MKNTTLFLVLLLFFSTLLITGCTQQKPEAAPAPAPAAPASPTVEATVNVTLPVTLNQTEAVTPTQRAVTTPTHRVSIEATQTDGDGTNHIIEVTLRRR
jgi:hypothetical protein